MTLSADLLRGYTDTLIMRQLAAEDGYGYGISRTLAEKSGGILLSAGWKKTDISVPTGAMRIPEPDEDITP